MPTEKWTPYSGPMSPRIKVSESDLYCPQCDSWRAKVYDEGYPEETVICYCGFVRRGNVKAIPRRAGAWEARVASIMEGVC